MSITSREIIHKIGDDISPENMSSSNHAAYLLKDVDDVVSSHIRRGGAYFLFAQVTSEARREQSDYSHGFRKLRSRVLSTSHCGICAFHDANEILDVINESALKFSCKWRAINRTDTPEHDIRMEMNRERPYHAAKSLREGVALVDITSAHFSTGEYSAATHHVIVTSNSACCGFIILPKVWAQYR